MSSFVTPPPPLKSNIVRTFSLGGKFFIILMLALVMSISGFFIESLTTERASIHGVQQASESAPAQPERLFGVELADSYRAIHRSLHYITLFLGLVFLTYFLFEVMTGRSVHPAQYALVGVAQTIFYLLLLSFAEHLGFDLSFLIAGGCTVGLFAINTHWLFHSRKLGMRALGVFTLLYAFIYVLLRVEAYALLVGAVASFFAVAAAMYVTRNVDWYGEGAPVAAATAAGGRDSWLD
ncbi:inner membrane protein [Granulicella rosea]|uniref:Inner membrane protein n=1 Tax=Granulicella rosea TaxID=474952 RepID=A0A239JPU2_9BACT|nr:inner membrane CreD family protein [Granulicella rosea]SNT06804.1 inner membrane protein [Granulicella rosea]